MKSTTKILTTIIMIGVLLAGTTLAQKGLLVSDFAPTNEPCIQEINNEKKGIIVNDLTGIIVNGLTGIIVNGLTGIIVNGATSTQVDCGIIVNG